MDIDDWLDDDDSEAAVTELRVGLEQALAGQGVEAGRFFRDFAKKHGIGASTGRENSKT